MKAWTDYPILALGDAAGIKAPIRECMVLSYDGNKYCRVRVTSCGSTLRVEFEIKAGYLYQQPGRCGDVLPVSRQDLLALPEWYEGIGPE